MTAKATTVRTRYVQVVLNGVISRQTSYDIAPNARHFLPVKFFFSSITSTAKCNLDRRITRVINTSTTRNWVRLARHIL